MKVKDITSYLESLAPLSLQESYDNSGLLTGSQDNKISAALITLDITEKTLDEAIDCKAGLVISHHPLIFRGLKRLTGASHVERAVIKAIKNNIAIYAAHTNWDNISDGVNSMICRKLNLTDCHILAPRSDELRKLVTFIPQAYASGVRDALFNAGAGHIGNYDCTGFAIEGNGMFRAGDGTHPFAGKKGKMHVEKEVRFETIFPKYIQSQVISALLKNHPYEEPAYDIYPLANFNPKTGMGMTGFLPKETSELLFLKKIKQVFRSGALRHSPLLNKKVKKVAVCGGSGKSLLLKAIYEKADFFITADVSYHDFFEADNKIVIVDAGHFETEQFIIELFYEILTEKFPTFAFYFSNINTNPIKYF